MKRFSEQFYKKSQTVILETDEKRELRERLVAYMEYHPLPAAMQALATKPSATLVAEPFFIFPFRWVYRSAAAIAVLVLVVIPVMAERAVPGDALYAIKVQNEELRGSLTFDSYQKVEWETERLNRRIAEARLLASEGRLTNEVEAEVAEAVKTHTENAKREIEVLRAEDADEAEIASIALDTTLEVQSTSLKEESADALAEQATSENQPRASLIANALDASLAAGEAMSESVPLPAYEKLVARVELNTSRIYELRDSIAADISGEQLADINRRIDDVNRSIQAAGIITDEDQSQAQVELVDVLQRTQKLIVFMTDLQVNQTVDINDLVPVVLTAEEERASMSTLAEEVVRKVQDIEWAVGKVESNDVLEKVSYSLEQLHSLTEKMATTGIAYKDFRPLADEANDLADDTLRLLGQQNIEIELGVGNQTGASTTDDGSVTGTTTTGHEEAALPVETGTTTGATDVIEDAQSSASQTTAQ